MSLTQELCFLPCHSLSARLQLCTARCVEVQRSNEQCPSSTLLPNFLSPRYPLPNQHRHSLYIDLQVSHPTDPISLSQHRMARHLRTKREHTQNQVDAEEDAMMLPVQSQMRREPISIKWEGCTRKSSHMVPARGIRSISYRWPS